MTFAILISGVVLLLGGLIMLIVSVAGSSKKLLVPSILISILGVAVLIFGLFYGVTKVVSGVGNTIKQTFEKADSIQKAEDAALEMPVDNWNAAEQNASIAYLKKMVPDSIRPYVKKRFFSKFYTFQLSRYPLKFPYAIHKINFNDPAAMMVNESALMDTRSKDSVTTNVVLNITHFVFDENFILLKTSDYDFNSNTQSGPVKYILMEFGKDGVFEFKTEKELMNAAEAAGYKGSFDFYTVNEYSQRFNTYE